MRRVETPEITCISPKKNARKRKQNSQSETPQRTCSLFLFLADRGRQSLFPFFFFEHQISSAAPPEEATTDTDFVFLPSPYTALAQRAAGHGLRITAAAINTTTESPLLLPNNINIVSHLPLLPRRPDQRTTPQ